MQQSLAAGAGAANFQALVGQRAHPIKMLPKKMSSKIASARSTTLQNRRFARGTLEDGEAIDVVQRQPEGERNHGHEECRPQSPALPGANPSPRQQNHRDSKGDEETGHRCLQVTDIVEEVRAERTDLLGRAADLLRREAEFNEPGKVPDEEHQSVANQPDSSERDELGAELGGWSERPITRCDDVSGHTGGSYSRGLALRRWGERSGALNGVRLRCGGAPGLLGGTGPATRTLLGRY